LIYHAWGASGASLKIVQATKFVDNLGLVFDITLQGFWKISIATFPLIYFTLPNFRMAMVV